jgi:signal transduction histidine kinase
VVLALGAWPLPAAGLLSLLLIGLSGPGFLVALETASRRGSAAPADSALSPPLPARLPVADAESEAAAPAASRRREEAILHDLKSPLSVLRVYSDLISEGARRGELPNPEHLANLSREIELAEKLLGAAEPPRAAAGGEREPASAAPAAAEPAPSADLVEILGSLATAYRLSLSGRRRIEFIAEKPELSVAADPVALQRAFRNVLENAVKYTPEGGEIRIRAGPAGPHAFVVFKDTGIGMTPEERTHAFDYAFRGAGALSTGTRGKGIGLAVTKEILEANGGRISLSSEAGFGSEVTILLPFARGAR